MRFDPSRCKKSSTSTSTVRRGGLSTKKGGNQRLPSEIPKQPKAIGDNGSTLAETIDQVSIPESGLAGLACFSSVSFFSRQGFLDS